MNKTRTDIQVDCYAGYRGEQTPRRFMISGQLMEVVSVIDRWVTPDYRYFKVEGDDHRVYTLRQSISRGNWQLD
jgi:hypothetical protein